MFKRFGLALIGAALLAFGAFGAHAVRNADGVRAEIVHFGESGARMGGMLYRPANATAQTPAPAVLAVHGFINTHEMQAPFAIELARRGFVVLALDQTGHGESAPPAFARGYGGPDGLRYLQSLPFVDRTRIVMTGHSMGGLALVAAAQDQPNGYRAMALVGSSTSFDGSPPPDNLRDVLLVFGRYDEFGQLMWQQRPQDIGQSARLMALFGAEQPVTTSGATTLDAARGRRLLALPAVTHPGEHLSNEVVSEVESWFSGYTSTRRDSSDQIWIWREAGALVGFAGFVLLMLGVFNAIAPMFAGLTAPAAPVREKRGLGWRIALALAALVPALLYLPVMLAGFALTQPTPWAPQAITNHIVLWALASALIALLIGLFQRSPKPAFDAKWFPGAAIAIGVAAISFGAFELANQRLQTNLGFWIVSLNPMRPWQETAFGLYLLPFAAFFLLTFRGLHQRLAVAGESALSMYATHIAALAGGMLLLVIALYVPLFFTGLLAVPIASLQAIIALQFVPILAICAVIGVYCYRRTNSYVPGALICALFVTWYVVTGTATMVWPVGMSPI